MHNGCAARRLSPLHLFCDAFTYTTGALPVGGSRAVSLQRTRKRNRQAARRRSPSIFPTMYSHAQRAQHPYAFPLHLLAAHSQVQQVCRSQAFPVSSLLRRTRRRNGHDAFIRLPTSSLAEHHKRNGKPPAAGCFPSSILHRRRGWNFLPCVSAKQPFPSGQSAFATPFP